MPSALTTQIVERAFQNRLARQRAADTARANPRASGPAGRGTFVAGTRVFDTVTGLEGVVIDVRRQHVVVPAAR